jgi:hypothetical protein
LSTSPPTRFGKYELLDRIAAGGMAELYRARYEPAPGITKQVVIKKILPHYAANRGFIAMFTDEARIAMGLSHGNIAQVFDFGAIDGDSFLAMELVDGQPLSKLLKRARAFGIDALPPHLATFAVVELLKGLHYAHTRLDEHGKPLQIVHRDVSPQNVLVSYEGQVKVVDFGIARARNAGAEDTSANAVKGKYVYFAPEQARARELDARADVFAAGVVLYELLTGQLPFQGRMMDVMSRIVRGQFPRPRQLNPRVPAELERIVLKAMALERADRFQTAEAFQQELSRHLASSHPDFTPGELGQFLQLLFEEELVAEGRPVQLPRDFVERAHRWKTPRGVAADAEVATEVVPVGGLDSAARPGASSLGRGGARPTVRRRRLALALLVTAAVTLGGGAAWLLLRQRPGALELRSTPPGASVTLDGRDVRAVTPTTITGLEGARPYRIGLTRDGFEPWSEEVRVERGRRAVLDATLVPLPESPPQVAPPAAPVPPPATTALSWPVERFEVDATRHRLDLSRSGALALPLDPTRTYRVTLARGPTLGWSFFAVNAAGAQSGGFSSRPLEMKGVTRLFAFHVPESALGAVGEDERSPRPLLLEGGAGAKRRVAHPVPARLDFPASARVTVTGLAPSAAYELTLRPGAAPLTGGATQQVVAGHPSAGLVPLRVGVPWRFTGARQVWLTLLDDGAGVTEGRLTAELRELPAPRKKRRR